ncbi:MAG TPA: hypothetical protein VMS37_02625 [Verrucomicrobiae bacterium]|nr:hypothetical protein [Verrucomicrobiae bacterium]
MMRAAALLIALCANAAAVELHVRFAALERMLSEQVFTQEGRRYVRGSQASKCNFAYLEKPQVRGENGRLRMKARFSGRSALNLAGQCVGLGDAFDVVILALPIYKNGAIGLQDVKVTSEGKTGFYIRRVCSAMEASLAHDFRYALEHDAQAMLENPAVQPNYQREVRRFTVSDIRVTTDALVLQVDFELTVK